MRDVTEIRQHRGHDLIDTGSPHYVIHVENTESIDVIGQGQAIRYDKHIAQDGVNVNFIGASKNSEIAIDSQVFALFVMIVAACELAIALALIYKLYHHFGQSDPDAFQELGEN